MQLYRIQIVLCVLALSACAAIDKPRSAATPDIALRPDPTLPTERGKAPDNARTRAIAAWNKRAGAAANGSDNSIYFSADDARLDEDSLDLLRRHATRLRENPRQMVTLLVYTDPMGSQSYNLALTEERLDNVVEVLRSQGVGRSQIRRISAGQALAAGNACDNPACRERMQRVELIYEK